MKVLGFLGVALMVATFAEPPEKPAGPTILDVGLPDGSTWTLGRKAVGRPFLVQVSLTNEGNAPIPLWDPKSTEGAACAYVVLADETGKETVLKPRPTPRAGGGPTFVSLEPTKVITYELELLRLVGPESLPPGRYRLTAFYENRLESAKPMPLAWTGKVQGQPRTITIIAPEP